MDNTWFSFSAMVEDPDSTDVYIFDSIGSWEISARTFIDQLKLIDTDHINLHINSPGGSVFDGVAIQNSLKHHKAEVTVYIDGIAASIASVIALAGDEVIIADNAYVMIHNPASIVWGEAKDMLKEAEVLNKLSDGLAGDYARKMGITVEAARALMDEETWYLGQEAVDAGFADAIFAGSQATASFDLARVSARAPHDAVARFARNDRQHKTREEIEAMEEVKKTTTSAEDDGQETAKSAKKASGTSTATTAADTQQQAKTDRENKISVDEAVATALKEDRQRQADIRELGAKFGFTGDAEKFAADGRSLEVFRAHILEQSPEKWRASLAIKNPSSQHSEQELADASEGASAVAKIKERRQARFGSK